MAERNRSALDAKTTAFTAPADVPLIMGNGFGLDLGKIVAMALSTPT
jgi:hypothetical protein